MTRRKMARVQSGDGVQEDGRVARTSAHADEEPTEDEFEEEEEEEDEEELEEGEGSDDTSGSQRRRTSTSPASGESGASRSPLGRFSHKIAERKRRHDMSDLFDQLKNVVPSDDSYSKSTKGRLLLRAASYVEELERSLVLMEHSKSVLIKELANLRRAEDTPQSH